MGLVDREHPAVTQPFDPDAFMNELGMALTAEASDEVKNLIFMEDRLATEIQGLQSEAKARLARVAAGEPGAVEALEAALRAAKSRIVACAPSHAYSLEKLVAKAIQRIMDKAREVGG